MTDKNTKVIPLSLASKSIEDTAINVSNALFDIMDEAREYNTDLYRAPYHFLGPIVLIKVLNAFVTKLINSGEKGYSTLQIIDSELCELIDACRKKQRH